MSQTITGIYQRGKIYWLTKQIGGQRLFTSLRTSDYVEAVKRAAAIIQDPSLNPTQGLAADMEAFFDYQVSQAQTPSSALYAALDHAWDQNLMTEWHIRSGGRGVMIYWHVERPGPGQPAEIGEGFARAVNPHLNLR